MDALFDNCLQISTGPLFEGAYSSVTGDSGNYFKGQLIGSKYGISAPVAAAWLAANQPGVTLTAAWMKALTLDTAKLIYRPGYWDSIWLNRVGMVSHGLAFQIWDHGINRGPKTSGLLFQHLIGITAVKDLDGVCGPGTMDAYAACPTLSLGRKLTKASAIAVQKAIGLTGKLIDGDYGAITDAAVTKGGYKSLVAIYALHDLQYADYKALPGASANSGWFTRCDARVPAALNLEQAT